MNVLLVAAGSAAGGVARWLVGELLRPPASPTGDAAFPLATLLVNVTGSFLLGLLAIVVARDTAGSGPMRLLLMVGFCGGYTTFSTFSLETVALVERGAVGTAALNAVASLGLAVGATFGGMLLMRAVYGHAPG